MLKPSLIILCASFFFLALRWDYSVSMMKVDLLPEQFAWGKVGAFDKIRDILKNENSRDCKGVKEESRVETLSFDFDFDDKTTSIDYPKIVKAKIYSNPDLIKAIPVKLPPNTNYSPPDFL